jgi:uncharacterized RDD family membrane protein YckC
MRERTRLEVPLPERAVDKVLLGLSAVALLALVPLLWIWLLYGSGLSGSPILVGGVGLCLLTAGVGAAMIRILDGIQ